MTGSGEERAKGVLVVGGGIAGMAAAMHLAQCGHAVHLVDSAPAIGGSMHLLDHTFPTLHQSQPPQQRPRIHQVLAQHLLQR